MGSVSYDAAPEPWLLLPHPSDIHDQMRGRVAIRAEFAGAVDRDLTRITVYRRGRVVEM